ncbi:AAA family ATPase [Humibacter soli]
MSRLIHLNGPSRVGKSTLARRYAAEHPGTLNLDVDVLAGLIGGWQDDFFAALPVAKDHAIAMGVRHLERGADVVLPQLITSYDGSPWADTIAEQAGADYLEIALLADPASHLRRLGAREAENPVDAHIQRALAEPDGELMEHIRADLDEYLADRPNTILIDTSSLDAEQTYQRIVAVIGGA